MEERGDADTPNGTRRADGATPEDNGSKKVLGEIVFNKNTF